MPRIYDADNDPIDLCNKCMPDTQEDAEEEYGACDYDCDHPNYGGEDYDCDSCGKRLTDKDN